MVKIDYYGANRGEVNDAQAPLSSSPHPPTGVVIFLLNHAGLFLLNRDVRRRSAFATNSGLELEMLIMPSKLIRLDILHSGYANIVIVPVAA
ncbi:hypothetical protein KSP40_PGU014330 [Platanthera guangdongensis]|uniref:Uncharacterized protein n=1 Tax=Platanthera guangdongensis TaxID=2320717 RepID=A0ABR2LXB8_9ASPA